MELVNLTPHDIHVFLDNGDMLTIKREEGGPFGRCSENRGDPQIVSFQNNPIYIYNVSLGNPEDLPEPEIDTLYIVSRITTEAAWDRVDLIYPDQMVRDNEGKIIGCKAFGRV